MKSIDAPLKPAIAANYDFTLGTPTIRQKISEARPPLDLALARRECENFEEANELLSDTENGQGLPSWVKEPINSFWGTGRR